jgi:hypothetical protein
MLEKYEMLFHVGILSPTPALCTWYGEAFSSYKSRDKVKKHLSRTCLTSPLLVEEKKRTGSPFPSRNLKSIWAEKRCPKPWLPCVL